MARPVVSAVTRAHAVEAAVEVAVDEAQLAVLAHVLRHLELDVSDTVVRADKPQAALVGARDRLRLPLYACLGLEAPTGEENTRLG